MVAIPAFAGEWRKLTTPICVLFLTRLCALLNLEQHASYRFIGSSQLMQVTAVLYLVAIITHPRSLHFRL